MSYLYFLMGKCFSNDTTWVVTLLMEKKAFKFRLAVLAAYFWLFELNSVRMGAKGDLPAYPEILRLLRSC